jgi:hypothetical protein
VGGRKWASQMRHDLEWLAPRSDERPLSQASMDLGPRAPVPRTHPKPSPPNASFVAGVLSKTQFLPSAGGSTFSRPGAEKGLAPPGAVEVGRMGGRTGQSHSPCENIQELPMNAFGHPVQLWRRSVLRTHPRLGVPKEALFHCPSKEAPFQAHLPCLRTPSSPHRSYPRHHRMLPRPAFALNGVCGLQDLGDCPPQSQSPFLPERLRFISPGHPEQSKSSPSPAGMPPKDAFGPCVRRMISSSPCAVMPPASAWPTRSGPGVRGSASRREWFPPSARGR